MKTTFNAPNRNVIIPGIVIVLLAVQTVSGAEGYLKSVGPPPLRFEMVDNNNTLFLTELELPKPKPVEQPAMPAPQAEAKPEMYIAASGEPSGTENESPFLGSPGQNGFVRGGSASDMLSITPQMISEYFKPYRAEGEPKPDRDERGQTFFVPAELGFVPPMPGSQAIYQSK